MKTPADKAFVVLTALFVAGLASVAGAVSFSHMRELASHHDQLGWKSYAFPIRVDGLEIVASLCLVAQRRAGRATGWVPWVALVVGTTASLAANVAVGGADVLGKALAGWPALSMLVSVKLLFAMFDHKTESDQRTGVPDVQRTSGTMPGVSWTVPDSGPDSLGSSATVLADRPADPTAEEPTAIEPSTVGHPGVPAIPVGVRTVAHLIPAARAARGALAASGQSLSRDHLADTMRDDGHGVSNGRASLLLKILKAEQDL